MYQVPLGIASRLFVMMQSPDPCYHYESRSLLLAYHDIHSFFPFSDKQMVYAEGGG